MKRLIALTLIICSTSNFASTANPTTVERMERDLDSIAMSNSIQSTMDMNQRNEDNLRRMADGYAK